VGVEKQRYGAYLVETLRFWQNERSVVNRLLVFIGIWCSIQALWARSISGVFIVLHWSRNVSLRAFGPQPNNFKAESRQARMRACRLRAKPSDRLHSIAPILVGDSLSDSEPDEESRMHMRRFDCVGC
jgi:hypothetical protein